MIPIRVLAVPCLAFGGVCVHSLPHSYQMGRDQRYACTLLHVTVSVPGGEGRRGSQATPTSWTSLLV